MDITTIVGIVVAIIICLIGLKMMLRKPDDAAPSLDTELQVNLDSNKPVIPRHVRHQLQAENIDSNSTERVEPSLNTAELQASDVKIDEDSEKSAQTLNEKAVDLEHAAMTTSSSINPQNDASEKVSLARDSTDALMAIHDNSVDVQTEKNVSLVSNDAHPPVKAEPEFVFNSNIATAQIQEFNEESSILDVHLHEQQRYDDESTLANAETIIALNVYPNPRKALSGDKTLKVMLKYGLRFGEMNCFHRYENTDEVSPLMFSVLRITDEGPAGFDLETLSGEQVQGLAFFLALPHSNVQKGYDSMVSIAGLIARETEGTVYDENNLEFTPQLKEHWRHKAIDYRSGQDL